LFGFHKIWIKLASNSCLHTYHPNVLHVIQVSNHPILIMSIENLVVSFVLLLKFQIFSHSSLFFPSIYDMQRWFNLYRLTSKIKNHITSLMGHDLAIIVVWNPFFISLYGIDMDVIHLLVLFKHQCHAHCLDTNVIYLFILFKHKCCMFIHVV
jgi:hypothetical protein